MVEYLKLAGAMGVLFLLAPIWVGISLWLGLQDKRKIRKYEQKLREPEGGAGYIEASRRDRAPVGPGTRTEAGIAAPQIGVVRGVHVGILDEPALFP
jgi:hypothetical protein